MTDTSGSPEGMVHFAEGATSASRGAPAIAPLKLAGNLRLDLGAGAVSPEGFVPLGNVNGTGIFPLPYGDETVDVVRSSHCLEHFPHRQIAEVIKDWVRVLKPGGELRIAVPNFEKIATDYLAGKPQITEGYVM